MQDSSIEGVHACAVAMRASSPELVAAAHAALSAVLAVPGVRSMQRRDLGHWLLEQARLAVTHAEQLRAAPERRCRAFRAEHDVSTWHSAVHRGCTPHGAVHE